MDAAARAGKRLARRTYGLRSFIVVVALIEGVGGLYDLPMLFGDMSEIPGYSPGGLTIIAALALRAPFAIAALILALANRPRYAVMALAGVVFVNWLNMLPSFILHGLDFQGSGGVFASLHFLLSIVLAGFAFLALKVLLPI